jgi:hypothetical protein
MRARVISSEKRPDITIDVARKAGIPLKIAAKVDVVDRGYFESSIKPRQAPPGVEHIGEMSETEKSEFLGNARSHLCLPSSGPSHSVAMI